MMKKGFCLWMCLLILCGCQATHGSFADGDLDIAYVMDKINANIADGKWKMGILKDTPLSKQEIEKQYHFDMTMIEECRVQQSLIPAQLSEIAIFKAEKQADEMLAKGLLQHKEDLMKQYGAMLMDSTAILNHAMQGRIGQYYYFVLGEDAKKVVHYMQEIK